MPDEVEPLSNRRVSALHRRALTYAEVGASLGELPPEYHHQDRSRLIGTGRSAFAAAAERILTWQMQLGAGLRVRAELARVEADTVVEIGLGLGRVRFWAPCRILQVVDEPRRRGFSYGTLPGHAEVGEEAFLVTIDDLERVRTQVRAFSRQGPIWARVLDPGIRLVQSQVAGRYLRALD